MSGLRLLARAEVEVALPGGVLVIAPPGAFGLAAGRLPAVTSASEIRALLAASPTAMAALRADWPSLNLPGVAGRLTEREIVDLLARAVADRRLTVAYLPYPIGPLDRLGPAAELQAPAVPVGLASRPVRDWSHSERIEAALKRVPAHLSGPLKEAFLGLISPTSIAITVGAFVALGVAQFFGYGEAADAVLAGIAYGIAGFAGVRALYDMVAATVAAATAVSEAELDAAAARLAGAFVVLGMAFLTIFIARAARRAAQERAAKLAKPAAEDAPAAGGQRPRVARTRAKGASDDAIPYANQPLYRVDDRPPGTIFNDGFQPRGTSTDLQTYVDTNNPSAFVGTSTSPDIASNPAFAKPGKYLYTVDGTQVTGIDVNKAYPANPFANESEFAVVGGVPKQAIVSASPLLPDGTLGEPIPNPFYKGGP